MRLLEDNLRFINRWLKAVQVHSQALRSHLEGGVRIQARRLARLDPLPQRGRVALQIDEHGASSLFLNNLAVLVAPLAEGEREVEHDVVLAGTQDLSQSSPQGFLGLVLVGGVARGWVVPFVRPVLVVDVDVDG
jgi:hypothetical protein